MVERRLSAAQAHSLGASRMHEALRSWCTRVSRKRLRAWRRATYKETTWREVTAARERERRGRQAELNALAEEAENSREAVTRWAEQEVATRTSELKRRTELAEGATGKARKRAATLEQERDHFRLEVGQERRKMAALRERCFRLEGDNEHLTRGVHVATLR